MGMDIPVRGEEEAMVGENWPRILLVGPPNVGKRCILQRLLAMGKVKGLPFSASGVLSHGWTIDTKYYTADVCISTARLMDNEANESAKTYALSSQCHALVLVFDLSNFSTFETVKEWAATLDLHNLEILLCVGNKADRLPDHFGHREYRKKLQKRGESSSDPHPEFWDFGIQQNDGSGLLGDKGDSADQLRSLCIEWCTEHGIEYLEACAVDQLFDQCISVDGDSQGLNRILGALSAHMWPGLILKAEKGLTNNLVLDDDEGNTTDSDSDITIDYERLSNGSAEPWDGDEGPWTFYESAPLPSGEQEAITGSTSASKQHLEDMQPSVQQCGSGSLGKAESSTDTADFTPDLTAASASKETEAELTDTQRVHNSTSPPVLNGQSGITEAVSNEEDSERVLENGRRNRDVESNDFEQLMMEMARMRDNARLMPDSQRREMAASLALRMASMFDADDL